LVKKAVIKRVLWVAGAGELEVKPGVRVIDSPDMPLWVKPGSLGDDQCSGPTAKKSLNWNGPYRLHLETFD
jgi:putative NADH-flavin reductase